MRCPCHFLERFRALPSTELVLAVLSRFIFGFGLGATLAAPRRSVWRRIGCIGLIVGTGMLIPAAIKVWEKKE